MARRCHSTKVGDVQMFVCTNERPAPLCPCGSGERGTKLCDFPLRGKKQGKTCDKRMCERCAANVGPDRDLCQAHHRLVRQADVPAQLLADESDGAMSVVGDLVEQKGLLDPNPRAKCKPGDGEAASRRVEQLSETSEPVVSQLGGSVAPDPAFRPRDAEEWREFIAERAAMFEYLNGDTREVAEAKARQLAGPVPRGAKHGPLFGGVR